MKTNKIRPPKDFIPFPEEALQGSLVDRFEQIVEGFSDNLAVHSSEEVLTYGQLNERANQLARAILANGKESSQNIAFLLGHSASAIVALWGILKSGNAYIALDETYPLDRLKFILSNTMAGLLLVDNRHLQLAKSLIQEIPGIDLINVDTISNELPSDNLNMPISPQDNAYIIYTSGSTGKPKGVIHTHRDILVDAFDSNRFQKFAPSDRLGIILSISFEAVRASIFGALLSGSTLCLFDIRSVGLGSLPAWIEEARLTQLQSTPSTFRHFLELVPKRKQFPLRIVSLGGEVCTSREVTLFRNHFSRSCVLINNLGMTEVGVLTRFAIDSQTKINQSIIPVGYPITEKEIFLVDEHNQTLGVNEIGEIVVRSKNLSPGYWNNPELTVKKFHIDPQNPEVRLYYTGDLGRIRDDGRLDHLGRKDEQIKIRGFRVELAEIETILGQHQGVKDVAVIAKEMKNVPDEKRIIAYLVPRNGVKLHSEHLSAYLSEKLPDYMIPDRYLFLDSLPQTPTGKLNHRQLPDAENIPQVRDSQYIAPRDKIEEQLVNIWEQILKTKPIGIQDDYFEMGGNSLLAASLFQQVEKTFGKKLPLVTLVQAPTIALQAQILRQADWIPDWSSLVTLRPHGTKPPLFFAAPVGGNVLSYYDLITHLDEDQPCYGLQALGLDGVQTPLRSVPEIAAHYINEIQAIQAKGPYYLCGSSFGGLVVYEMAQQLHDAGQPVALVVMFDTYGPNYPRRVPGTTRLHRIVYKFANRLDTHFSNLKHMDWRSRMVYLQEKSRKISKRLSRRMRRRINQIIHPLPRELKKIQATHMGAAKRRTRYMREARRFPGRLVLFRAEKQPLGIYPDDKLGWGAVVGDNIEVFEIPGHHTSIIYQPRVHILAEIFNKILSEVQATEESSPVFTEMEPV